MPDHPTGGVSGGPGTPAASIPTDTAEPSGQQQAPTDRPAEHGGPSGLEPTRYGDWERMGRCHDF